MEQKVTGRNPTERRDPLRPQNKMARARDFDGIPDLLAGRKPHADVVGARRDLGLFVSQRPRHQSETMLSNLHWKLKAIQFLAL
jgi:hypothetical protein